MPKLFGRGWLDSCAKIVTLLVYFWALTVDDRCRSGPFTTTSAVKRLAKATRLIFFPDDAAAIIEVP